VPDSPAGRKQLVRDGEPCNHEQQQRPAARPNGRRAAPSRARAGAPAARAPRAASGTTRAARSPAPWSDTVLRVGRSARPFSRSRRALSALVSRYRRRARPGGGCVRRAPRANAPRASAASPRSPDISSGSPTTMRSASLLARDSATRATPRSALVTSSVSRPTAITPPGSLTARPRSGRSPSRRRAPRHAQPAAAGGQQLLHQVDSVPESRTQVHGSMQFLMMKIPRHVRRTYAPATAGRRSAPRDRTRPGVVNRYFDAIAGTGGSPMSTIRLASRCGHAGSRSCPPRSRTSK